MITSLKDIHKKPLLLAKVVGGVILALLVLAVVFRLVAAIITPVWSSFDGRSPSFGTSGGMMGGDRDYAYDDMAEEAMYNEKYAMNGIAATSFPAPIPPRDPNYIPGNDAEDIEVTQYSATIRTKDSKAECAYIASLKSREDIIFENANEHETGCSFSFKVEKERAPEVLSLIEARNPEHLSENTYTIKRTVDRITSETEILKERLASINETLENALNAYDEISQIAVRSNDAESLASIIDSKVRLIERLTQDRINITSQLSRLERSMSDQLDRLGYTQFGISVYEDKYFDGEELKNSWRRALKNFVSEVNEILQQLSVGLGVLLLQIVQYAIYFVILLFVAKFAWKFARGVWKK